MKTKHIIIIAVVILIFLFYRKRKQNEQNEKINNTTGNKDIVNYPTKPPITPDTQVKPKPQGKPVVDTSISSESNDNTQRTDAAANTIETLKYWSLQHEQEKQDEILKNDLANLNSSKNITKIYNESIYNSK